MVSPLRKARDAIIQQELTGSSPLASPSASPDSLQLQLTEFANDRQSLKQFNAIADKVTHKRDVLMPKWRPIAEAFLSSGEHYENPIFSTLILWLFDIGEIELGIDWCLKAIELNLPTPEFIKRDWPTFCADVVFDWAEKQAERGQSIEPYFSQVFSKVQNDWRLHEKVNAKWYKFAGYWLLRDDKGEPRATAVGDISTLEQAKALLEQAHNFHDKVGVGTMIKRIESRINALEDNKNL